MDPMSGTAGFVAALVQTLVALVLVCLAAWWILRWGVARGPLASRHGRLEVIDRVALDARRAVYLVRVANRVLVVGAGDHALSLLAELDARELPAKTAAAAATVAGPTEWLRALWRPDADVKKAADAKSAATEGAATAEATTEAATTETSAADAREETT